MRDRSTNPRRLRSDWALRAAAPFALCWLLAAPASAQDAPPVPPPPAAPDDAGAGLGARLDDPSGGPARAIAPRTRPAAAPRRGAPTIEAYVAVTPESNSAVPEFAERLRLEGRDSEALELMADYLLEPHPPFDLDGGHQLALTLRNLQPPPYDNAPVVLGGIFMGLGAGGILATSLIYVFDGVFSTREPLPYVFAFTVAGASVVGGLISLIAGLVARDSGPVGQHRSTAHRLHRALREDAHRVRAARQGRLRR